MTVDRSVVTWMAPLAQGQLLDDYLMYVPDPPRDDSAADAAR